MHNVVPTLFQRQTPMLCQCCVTLKIRYRILFHFQQRYFNVDPTLKCWLGHRGLIILKDIEDIFTAKCFYIPLKVFKIFFLIATFLATWTTCLLKFLLSAAFMLQDEEGVHYISIRYLKNYVIMTFFGTFPVKTPANSEAVVQRCSIKKLFLEFCKVHRKTPVPESLHNQLY